MHGGSGKTFYDFKSYRIRFLTQLTENTHVINMKEIFTHEEIMHENNL